MDIIRKLELIPATVQQGKICHEAIQTIKSLRSQLSSQWISVDDRLPEIYTDVLLFTQHDTVVIGNYMGHKTFSAQSKYPVLGQCEPTHWMKLPEKPKS